MTRQPSVSVVISTCGRPKLLREAVAGALYQEYDGDLEVIVVYDQIDIDPLDDIAVPEKRFLRTIANDRSPGLPGGRNSGIMASSADLIAFCDDDDRWLPGKLRTQVSRWQNDPAAIGMVTGIRIDSPGSASHERLAPAVITFEDFLADRITAAHPSSYLFRRADLLDRIGLVDEDLPFGYGEDYDLLLRATRHGHIRAVEDALVVVNWNRPSFFSGRWQGIADGLTYILDQHPEFDGVPRGKARIEAQIAFAHAALGNRGQAKQWAKSGLAHDPKQVRAYLAFLVASKLLSANGVMAVANRFGRGI